MVINRLADRSIVSASCSSRSNQKVPMQQRPVRLWRGARGIFNPSPAMWRSLRSRNDNKYTRIVGMFSYGIDGMFDDLDDGRAHGRDERIGIAAFT
ncbi:MAG: hypothetical protein QOF42_942 [Gammaproteobacteria bacterium]|nr:hypothetical protein [Gammaproteobacteria bacterium]